MSASIGESVALSVDRCGLCVNGPWISRMLDAQASTGQAAADRGRAWLATRR